MVWFLKQCKSASIKKKTMLCYVINNNEMHYVIFNPRVSHDSWTCAFIMGWKHFSFTVFFSRWSVQRAPTGHNLFTLSSSLADSWEESRRKLLSWSFRTRSDIPLSSAVIPSPYYHKAGSARLLWKKKNILTIWKTRKYVVVSFFFFLFFFSLWEMFADICETWICCSGKCESWDLDPVYQTPRQTHSPVRTLKGLCSHVGYSSDICRQADNAPEQMAVGSLKSSHRSLMNNKRMCTINNLVKQPIKTEAIRL